MPFGVKPSCSSCKTTETTMWRKTDKGEIVCNTCKMKVPSNGAAHKPADTNATLQTQLPSYVPGTAGASAGSDTASVTGRNTPSSLKGEKVTNGSLPARKSARTKAGRHRSHFTTTKSNPVITKGKNRRIILKKNDILKPPQSVATIVTCNSIWSSGRYFQIGDVVSLLDEDDDCLYYAQIEGFLQDQYCEKSAVITWLLPTLSSPREQFDPATYIIGPTEELPRKLEYMEFVCHAPAEYFKAKTAPYQTEEQKPQSGFVWTSVGPEVRALPTVNEIFSGST